MNSILLSGIDEVCIWGGGKRCRLVVEWLVKHDIRISCIVDSNPDCLPSQICGINVVSPEFFYTNHNDCLIVVSSEKYADEIINILIQKGISKYISFEEMDALGKDNDKNREKWIVEKLHQVKKGKRILDAGAGELRYKPYCTHLDYVSQDFCQYDGIGDAGLQTGRWDTSRIDIVSDIIDIPVPNESFDVILCSEVLEHIKNPPLAIKEFSRILRTGGELILTAPFASLTHFAPYHFSTGFSVFWFRDVLHEYGLSVVEEVSNGDYFSYMAQEVRRLESIAKKYSDYECGEDDRLLLSNMVALLDKMDVSGNKSSELLCYGWQIVAVK